jgi:hypothetical protein
MAERQLRMNAIPWAQRPELIRTFTAELATPFYSYFPSLAATVTLKNPGQSIKHLGGYPDRHIFHCFRSFAARL